MLRPPWIYLCRVFFFFFFFANKAKLQCTLNRSNKRMLWRYHYFPYVFISQPGMFHAGQKRDYCHLAKHPFKRCSLLLCQHNVAFCSEGMDISIQTETSLVFFFSCLLIFIMLPEISNQPRRWWKTLIAVPGFSQFGGVWCKNPVRHRCQFSAIFWNAILVYGRKGGVENAVGILSPQNCGLKCLSHKQHHHILLVVVLI